ncbi:hypothetical protein AXG93_3719s1050 [Marchantia polymorpha subsp. ruderalis]|uniref:HAT C-terminal dimerisation domain-containing protein n=1 Tax=Marchantia polymorpha subsp. ruderalis TaxID=1480154 RepID=A0A176VQ95_MARPO|nr:hypothetical protein AXG93_3719s1050 [Marchantia polymorpha subsp. ruderalis]
MMTSSSSSLNAQVMEKELKKTSSNDADCVFLLHKNHASLNSALWKKFDIVQQHDKDCDYATCFTYKKVYTFKKTTGTSTMSNHKCLQVERSDSGAMKLFATKGVPTTHDKKMTLAYANFCAVDLRPFQSIAGLGLKGLVQTTLDISVASNKRLMVDDLLCQPVTTRRNIETCAMKGHVIVANRLQEHIDTDVFMAITLDLWTDNIKKLANISVTTHYIDKEFALFAQTLHVKRVRYESHTAVMVMNKFKEALDIFSIKDLMFDKITVVADCGSNIVTENGISSEFDLLGCIDHKITNCLTYVLKKTTKQVDGKKSKLFFRYLDEPNMTALYALVDACKSLVTSKDSPTIIACKCLLTPLVQEKMELDVLHVVSTLLDTVMKNHMRKMEVPDASITKAKAKLRALMGSIGTGEVLANFDHEKDDAQALPQKKRRIDDMTSMYDEFEEELEEIHGNGAEILVVSNLDSRIELELSKYETYKVTNLKKNEFNSALRVNRDTIAKFSILLWWKLKGDSTFPIMSRVARLILCIPASISKSE